MNEHDVVIETQTIKICPPPKFFSKLGPWPTLVVPLKGVRKGGLGLDPSLELDISQKLYYLRKGD